MTTACVQPVGTWAPIDLPESAAVLPGGVMVSCTPDGFCMSVVSTGEGSSYVAVGNLGGSWRAVAPTSDDVRAVSCASVTFCAVGGFDSLGVWDGTTWRSASTASVWGTDEGDLPLESVSCGSPALCVAVTNGHTARWDGQQWRDTGSLGDGISQVSCVTAAFCLAGMGVDGSLHRWDGQQWTKHQRPGSARVTADAITCWAVDACRIAGADLVQQTPPNPRALRTPWHAVWNGRELLAAPAPSSQATIARARLSCSAPSRCLLLGTGPEPASILAGNPPAWRSAPAPRGEPTFHDVSCARDTCLAGGAAVAGAGPVPVAYRWIQR
jgi:hypothetical protein